jgi:hypothetical protein
MGVMKADQKSRYRYPDQIHGGCHFLVFLKDLGSRRVVPVRHRCSPQVSQVMTPLQSDCLACVAVYRNDRAPFCWWYLRNPHKVLRHMAKQLLA